MKERVRYIVSLAALSALVLAFFAISRGKIRDRSLLTCEGISITYEDEYRFVSDEDIKGYLDQHYGPYIGQRLDSIRLHRVEEILDSQSAILKSEAYTTDDGMLNISITQREPVVRFQTDDYGFYADECGFIFPLQEKYTSLVPVIDGNIPIKSKEGYKGIPETEKEQEWMRGILSLLDCMNKNKYWSDNIVQMHVDNKSDLILIPRTGTEKFIFGSPFEAASKFERMEDYYKYILPEKGEGYYRTVNVKFDKQIVCKK